MVWGFIRHDNLLAWRELFTNLPHTGAFTNLCLAFDFGRKTATLSKFIGYADLTDCREILPEHSRDNDKPKGQVLGNFNILHIFPVASIYPTRLAYF